MKQTLLMMWCLLATLTMQAQKIDFDAAGKRGDAKHTEQGFWGWDVARSAADTLPKMKDGVPQWQPNSVGGEKLPDGMQIIVTNASYNAETAADGYYGVAGTWGGGKKVVHVTSLEDDGTEGTLRWALETVTGPRTVVFDISGIITLNKPVTVNESYVTIAGQTAPGDGIMIRGGYLYLAGESITRFIRHRMGSIINEDKGTGYSGITIQGRNNAIVDHASVGWATAETFKADGVLVGQGHADGAAVDCLPLKGHAAGVYILKVKDTEGRDRSFSVMIK